MATENISIIMLERMWELLSGIVADKTGTADAKLEAAIAAAAMMVHLGTMNEVFSASNLVI